MSVFLTQLCDLYPPLLSGSTLPLSPLRCEEKYTVSVSTYTVYGGGDMGFWASYR
jgi:hypothetical protein